MLDIFFFYFVSFRSFCFLLFTSSFTFLFLSSSLSLPFLCRFSRFSIFLLPSIFQKSIFIDVLVLHSTLLPSTNRHVCNNKIYSRHCLSSPCCERQKERQGSQLCMFNTYFVRSRAQNIIAVDIKIHNYNIE